MVSSYSRCKLGKRCVKKTKDNKVFIKFTLVCAINSKGVAGWTLYETGGMIGNRMSDFINKFIKNKYKNNLIIMDNGGAHKNECVKQTIKETNNSLLYSVPYRPKTNAIESWFSQFKHYFKNNETGISFPNLKKSVREAIRKIPAKSYLNYMKYAYKNKDIRKFIEKPSTRRKTLKNYKL
jgi:transposase